MVSNEDCSQVEEILDYRDRLGVPEYLIRWCGRLSRADTWEPEGKLLPSARALVDEFQQLRAQRRKESKQRLPCGVPSAPPSGWCGDDSVAAPPAPPPAARTGDPAIEPAPSPPAATVTSFSSASSSPPAARPNIEDHRPAPSEPSAPTPSQLDQPTTGEGPADGLSPADVAALSAVDPGWLDRFVAFYSPRLSQQHMIKLMRTLRPLASGDGADFGPSVGVFLAGRPVHLHADVPSLRRELLETRGGVFKRADQGKGGWTVSHPLTKLTEFQVTRLHARSHGVSQKRGLGKWGVGKGESGNGACVTPGNGAPGNGAYGDAEIGRRLRSGG